MPGELRPDIELDPKSFWQAISNRAGGVSIVTSAEDGVPAGFLGLSASHLTASPPLLTVSVDLRTSALAAIRATGAFAVNYLSAAGAPIYERFAARSGVEGVERFSGLHWDVLSTGSPVFRDIVVAFDCRVEELIERHGTVLAIGRIVNTASQPGAMPLVYLRGSAAPLRS